jgi:hypothetical protein
MSLFVEKYQPTLSNKIVGNQKILMDILSWIQSPTTKLCLIHGPTGIGKSLCVKLICDELNIQPYYVDNISENFDINILKSLNRNNSITHTKNYIIIEEIDTISNLVLDEIVNQINNIHVPIICISNTNYIPSIKSLSDKIINFKMFPPYNNEISSFLYPILKENKIFLKQDDLNDIITNCKHDIRYILNTIEMMKYGQKTIGGIKDNISLNMFEVSKELFNMDKTIEEKYNLFFLEYSMMPLFIQENYINNTFNVKNILTKMDNISNSSESISSGDLIERMLHENNDWDLQKYVAICDIEATNKCNTKIMKFPEYFKKNKKQFCSYDNSLKSINYYYPMDSQIDKLSVDKKKSNNKQSVKKSELKTMNNKNKKINTKQKNKNLSENLSENSSIEIITKNNSEEPLKLKILPIKISNKKKKIRKLSNEDEEEELSFSKPQIIKNVQIESKLDQENEEDEEEEEELSFSKPQIIKNVQIESKLDQENEENEEEEEELSFSKPLIIKNVQIETNTTIEGKTDTIKLKQKNKLVLKRVEVENDENTILCECGTTIKKLSKFSHLKSKKHFDLLEKNKNKK